MITLIGTGHVFNLSQALLTIFNEKQPDVLCIELDAQRYQALLLKKADPEKYKEQEKNLPIIYKLLARFQEGMANEYGVTAGHEMLTTAEYAQSHQIPLAFIDMNAQNLFSKMLKKMTFREKLRLMFSGFSGLFISKKRVEKELEKIQGDLDMYITELSKKFPTIKKVLVDQRNTHMEKQLKSAQDKFEKVIAIVGDGHIPGLSKLLSDDKIEFETIRLSELRNKSTIEPNSSTASFSHEYKDF